MDTEVVTKQVKDLKAKARAARKEGKKELAAAFRSGMKRASRKLRAVAPPPAKKKED